MTNSRPEDARLFDRPMRLRPPHAAACNCRQCAALDEIDDGELDHELRRSLGGGATAPGRATPRSPGKPRPAVARHASAPRALVRQAAPVGNCPTRATEFVRWLQSRLNQQQGLQLPVDGVMSPAVRSALRALQQQQGLPADGIAGPDTEGALTQGPASAGDVAAPDTAPAPESEALEFIGDDEWEGEVSRSSRDYIMWVQRSLNRLLGLSLAVDGISGTLTRSAVRDFQSRKGLEVDGIVGPITEAALIAAGAGNPPGYTGSAPSAPVGGNTRAGVNTALPASGTGFYSYTEAAKRYGLPETIAAVKAIAAAWSRAHAGRPRLGIGNISLQGGGPFPPHSTHQDGLNVDIRPLRSDRVETGVTYTSSAYSRSLTQELVNLIRANSVLGVSSILFNDSAVSGVKPWEGHDDHLHISFVPPAVSAPPATAPMPSAPAYGGSGSSLRNQIARIALAEWESWQRGSLKENNAAVLERLVQYWMGVGYSRSDAEGRARLSQGEDPAGYWSAAFISWVVRQAGATSSQFAFSGAHSTYIAAAYQNRVQHNGMPFTAWSTSEVAPRIGDMVCYAYSSSVPTTVATVKPDTSGYHTDIVVAIDSAAQKLTVIGGNVSDSVSAKQLDISSSGFLINADPRYFGVLKVDG